MLILFQEKRHRIEALAFSPDGKKLASGSNFGSVRIWSVAGGPGEDLMDVPHRNSPFGWQRGAYQVQFSPEGQYIAAAFGSLPGTLIFDLHHDQELTTNQPRWATGLAFDIATGVFIQYGSHSNSSRSGHLSAWRFSTSGVENLWSGESIDGFEGRLDFFPAGDRILLSTQAMGDDLESFVGTVTVRSASSGDVVKTLQSPNHIASKCRVCPQGRLCSVLACRAIVVWESDGSSEPVARVTNGNRKSFTDLAFHPSGRYLAATSNDTTVKLYDTESWQVAKTFTWNVGRLRSIAFSPDGTLAAVGSDSGKIVVWDVDL